MRHLFFFAIVFSLTLLSAPAPAQAQHPECVNGTLNYQMANGWHGRRPVQILKGRTYKFCIDPKTHPEWPGPGGGRSSVRVKAYDTSDHGCGRVFIRVKQLEAPFDIYDSRFPGSQGAPGGGDTLSDYDGLILFELEGLTDDPLIFLDPITLQPNGNSVPCNEYELSWKLRVINWGGTTPSPPPAPLPPPGPKPALPPLPGFNSGLMPDVPGCDTDFWERTLAFTEAMVLQDVAETEELTRKPDSVAALSCQDRATLESAKAGQIFSDIATNFVPVGSTNGLGIFKPGFGTSAGFNNIPLDSMGNTLAYIVAPNLENILKNSFGSIGDKLAPYIGGTLTSLFDNLGLGTFFDTLFGGLFGGLFGSTKFECDSGKNLWNEVSTDGTDTGFRIYTVDDILAGNVPGARDNYVENLENYNGPPVRKKAEDAILGINPGGLPYFPAAPSFGDNTRELSVDQVLGEM